MSDKVKEKTAEINQGGVFSLADNPLDIDEPVEDEILEAGPELLGEAFLGAALDEADAGGAEDALDGELALEGGGVVGALGGLGLPPAQESFEEGDRRVPCHHGQ